MLHLHRAERADRLVEALGSILATPVIPEVGEPQYRADILEHKVGEWIDRHELFRKLVGITPADYRRKFALLAVS